MARPLKKLDPKFVQDLEVSVALWASNAEIAARWGLKDHNIEHYVKRLGLHGLRPKNGAGDLNTNWKGGRRVLKSGYVLVYCPQHPHAKSNGRGGKYGVFEHRLVMEAKLGRYLEPHEVVHHLDEDRGNNDPDNLELHQSNGDHMKKHAGKPHRMSQANRQKLADLMRQRNKNGRLRP